MVLQYMLCIGIPPAVCVGMGVWIIHVFFVLINYNWYDVDDLKKLYFKYQ